MIDWTWLGGHLDAIAFRTWQHVYLAGLGVAIGFAISFVLALVAARYRILYPPISALAGFLFTIPSLALFAALISITGFSVVTAEVPLVMYTLVILIRNIVAGFDGVPAEVVEAADGMGHSRRQRLWRVELPLALPLIVAGLRLATVSTIGLVTITGTISDAFGGLGYFILDGYHRGNFLTEMYAGAVPSILLALGADFLFVRLQRRITPWTRARAIETAP
ncbi:MAG TPA: ABC transporter permease [Verrucomicrobiae bacterium]|nr:ABC transporter permease [Verrucomicrobiae bacterium]